QPVGVIILSENASIYAGGMFGVITELYVVPAQRSAGVATKLVDAAATLGRKRSWGRIEVGALERSLKFYLSAGFVELGPRLHLLLGPPAQPAPRCPPPRSANHTHRRYCRGETRCRRIDHGSTKFGAGDSK